MEHRILIIEDDDIVRDTLKMILEHRGFQVTTSSSGINIKAQILEDKPDLILTDIFLGDLDGREICQTVKNDPETSNIPVIIISGCNTEIYNTISEFGANDVVLKPFDELTLLNRVQRQLSTH
jgi:DNA-binding response OmpR family regulator